MKKKFLASLFALSCVFFLNGCGINVVMELDTLDSAKQTFNVYSSQEDEQLIMKTLKDEINVPESYDEFMKEGGYTYGGTEVLNQKVHKRYFVTGTMPKEDLDSQFIIRNKDKFEINSAKVSETYTEDYSLDSSVSISGYDLYTLTITYPYKIAYSNGTIQKDGKTVVFDLLKNEDRCYALINPAYKNVKTYKLTGVKNNGYYKKNKTLKLQSENVITQFRVNGVAQTTNSYTAKEEGKYKVSFKLLSGVSKTVKFTIDKTKPTTNVKAKTYKKTVKITFKDKLSGIKKATLNGKKIKSGKKVSKNGNYTLKIYDKASNVKTVKFKIDK